MDRFREYYMGNEITRTTASIDKINGTALLDVVLLSCVDQVKTLDSGIDRAYIDRNKLVLVVHSLVEGAIRRMPEGSRVTISTLQQGDQFSVTVSDTGAGFPETTPETIFTPSAYKARDGTGPRLPIARRVVEAHRGDVSIGTNLEKKPPSDSRCIWDSDVGRRP